RPSSGAAGAPGARGQRRTGWVSTCGRAVAPASSRVLTFGLGGSANEVQVGDVQPERLPDSPDPASRTTSAPVPRLDGNGPCRDMLDRRVRYLRTVLARQPDPVA